MSGFDLPPKGKWPFLAKMSVAVAQSMVMVAANHVIQVRSHVVDCTPE